MRKPRILREGARYHVTARFNRKEFSFDIGDEKKQFMDVLKRAKKKYCFNIENFCLMGNHFHFIIIPGTNQSLSRIMQWVLSVYAMAFNKRHKYWGHVWGDRFFSEIIDTIARYIILFDYINKNPLKVLAYNVPFFWEYSGLNYFQKGDFDFPGPLDEWIRELYRNFNRISEVN